MGSNDVRAYFFFASWCNPCKRVKPYWDDLKLTYLVNGITCLDNDYDSPETKPLMNALNVKTVPTLVVVRVPHDNKLDDFTKHEEIYRGDSETIPHTAARVVHEFSMDEDF